MTHSLTHSLTDPLTFAPKNAGKVGIAPGLIGVLKLLQNIYRVLEIAPRVFRRAKGASQLTKSVQKQRSIWLFSRDEVGLSGCTVVALWPDKGAEMGQFGRPPYLVQLHTLCHTCCAISGLIWCKLIVPILEQRTSHIWFSCTHLPCHYCCSSHTTVSYMV